MLYTLRQEHFENGNVIFREGEMCKGIIFVMEGGVELSYTENGNSILIDTLMQGSYLFSYSCLTEESISMTGVAVGKTTVLVLPYDTLDASRCVNNDFNAELEAIEDSISNHGVPLCDYTRHPMQSLSPVNKFQKTVRKIISLKRLEKWTNMNFTSHINKRIIKKSAPSDRHLINKSVSDRKASFEEQALEQAT